MNSPQKWFAPGLFFILTLCVNLVYSQNSQPYSIVSLPSPLTQEIEQTLKTDGVVLKHFFGNGLYLVSGSSSLAKTVSSSKVTQLKQVDEGVLEMLQQRKDKSLVELDIVLGFPEAAKEVEQVLAKAGFNYNKNQVEGGVTIRGQLPIHQVEALLEHPLIVGLSKPEGELSPYNFELRIGQTITPLNSSIPGSPNLNGEGIVIGVGDGGKLSGHPDIGDRVIYSTSFYNAGWGNHPDMVSGILGGAGTVDPKHRGIACEAELVIESTSAIVYQAPSHLATYGMTITNNSYGPTFNCSTANKYYGASASADQQLFDNPELLHVFAAGNSGNGTCNNLPTSYGTIPGGVQTAKNVLTVGNLNFNRTRFSSSSAGPAFDGRLKPEICGIGRDVTTCDRQANYTTGTGTSMSSPGVAGTLALLSQRFQQLSPGTTPDGALLKAIACNSASDLGNEGPDYHYGYGLIDGTRAVKVIEESRYYSGVLAPAASYQQTLPIPSGAEVAKVLLYWPDQAGPTSNSGPTLVNDFDLYILTPALDTIRPWVLDPSTPAATASRGIDTLNNIEQVTINSPSAGQYTVRVEGKNLPLGTTDFYLTWEVEMPEVILTCPYGGESLQPNQATYIAWSASYGQNGTWKLEYNQDNAGWQTIASGIATNTRSYQWVVPNTTGELEFRVTNESSNLSDQTNELVTLISTPTGLEADTICNGQIRLGWHPTIGATAYQVFGYQNNEMELLATVTDTSATLNNLKIGDTGYYSVTAVAGNGKLSQRAIALSATSVVDGPDCQIPLPINWVSISSENSNNGVLVKWTVANEYDSDRYELYRGQPVGDTLNWELVMIIKSEGNQTDLWDYQARDSEPYQSATSYYRVKQVDLDGTENLSAIVAHTMQASTTREQFPVTLAQNPVRDELLLRSGVEGPQLASLYDTSGRLRETFEIQQGHNAITWPDHLGAGLYVLRIEGQAGAKSMKLVKGSTE